MHHIRKTQVTPIVKKKMNNEHSDNIFSSRLSFVWKWYGTLMSHHFSDSSQSVLFFRFRDSFVLTREQKECNVENKLLLTFTGMNNQFWYFISVCYPSKQNFSTSHVNIEKKALWSLKGVFQNLVVETLISFWLIEWKRTGLVFLSIRRFHVRNTSF